MDSTRNPGSFWVRFLFNLDLPPVLLPAAGVRPGGMARALLKYMQGLLDGHHSDFDSNTDVHDVGALDAVFAHDAGIDWDELGSCHATLSTLIENGHELEARALLAEAEEFVDDFLYCEPGEGRRFIDDVVEYGRRRATTQIRVVRKHMQHIKISFLFAPWHAWSGKLAEDDSLALFVLNCVHDLLAWKSNNGKPVGLVKRLLAESVEEHELHACADALTALLEGPEEHTVPNVHQAAETFLDDYLFLDAPLESRFIQDIIEATAERITDGQS